MDRETLLQAIEHGPVRATINDGSSYDIELRVSKLVEVASTAFWLLSTTSVLTRRAAMECPSRRAVASG